MKIVEKLKKTGGPSFAFEIVPTSSGSGLRDILEAAEFLMPLNPQWIDVTTHAQNSLEISGAVQNHFRVPAVAHLVCKGFSREQTDEALEELNSMGVQNVLLLQGEEPLAQKPVKRDAKFNAYASDLVKQVSYSAFNFCIGVAGYPEKHVQAKDLASDIENLKRKCDAGAHYILTQMFFDNKVFFDFVDKCRAAGIQQPIVPGLRVLNSAAQLHAIPERFHCTIPQGLRDMVHANPETVAEIGGLWAETQARELLKCGFSTLHFFVLDDARGVKQVVDSLNPLTNP